MTIRINGVQLMESNKSDLNKQGIAHFAALKTAIANGEELLVKDLLTNQPMIYIEKSYLIDLAQLTNNPIIMKLLEGIPVKE
ncbi:MAG: hypothetical protein ACJAXJ_001057 [Colwellia sp.]|jgi:hypothetical protein